MKSLSNIVTHIESNNFHEAHSLIEHALYIKTGTILEEVEKRTIAKTFPSKADLKEEDSKSLFKKAQRKSLKDKMSKVGKKEVK